MNERVSRRAMKKCRKAERQRTFVVPFRFRGLLMLQIAGIFALSVATYLGPTPDLGFMDVSFYEINAGGNDIAVFINLAIGTGGSMPSLSKSGILASIVSAPTFIDAW